MVARLTPSHWGVPLTRPYQHSRANATAVLPSLKGRPRLKRRDEFPVYLFSVVFDWNNPQFEDFQKFWRVELNYGINPFEISLAMVDETANGYLVEDTVLCRARNQYSATMTTPRRWTVTLDIELPAGTNLTGTGCDVIYGGPIFNLATDDIYPGTPGDLAPDIIQPCPIVDPQQRRAA